MGSYVGGLKNWYKRKSNYRMPLSFRPTKRHFSHKDFQNAKLSSLRMGVSSAKEGVEPLPWSKLGEQWWLKDEQRWTFFFEELERKQDKKVCFLSVTATTGTDFSYFDRVYDQGYYKSYSTVIDSSSSTNENYVPIGNFE